MIPKSQLICGIIASIIVSCSPANSKDAPEKFNVDPKTVLKDAGIWWNYNIGNIKLAENYIAFDTASNLIDREKFLHQLSSGNYVAFQLITVDSSLKYKLYRIDSTIEKGIHLLMMQYGKDGYRRYKMEGTEIPGFNFTDLNGKVYSKATTKGKIVILKCWFIHCQVCVEEMPALNAIVKQYKNRNDVLFISLAFDTKEELKNFLIKTKFDYAVIPVKYEYLEKELGVNEYPTQFIVGKDGKISKVVTYYQDMVSVLKRELLK